VPIKFVMSALAAAALLINAGMAYAEDRVRLPRTQRRWLEPCVRTENVADDHELFGLFQYCHIVVNRRKNVTTLRKT
jgi:hypothetical protein